MLGGGSGAQVVDLSRRIEKLGFDSIFVGDHVSFHVPILDSLTLLTYAAAATERVSLGTAVYLLPLRHPTLTAKVTSTLDFLSGGRLVLGVGVGGEFPPEFDATGVPVAERGPRTDEAIEVLRRLWTEKGVVHKGRHFSFGPVSIDPKPKQAGGPPIWVGGRKGPSFRRAGQLGDGYISHMASPDQIRDNLTQMQQHAEKAGREETPFATASLLFTALDPSYESALDRAATFLERLYARPFRDAAARYTLLGRPEDCLAQMRRFADAGTRHFLLSPLGEPSEFIDQVAADILPALDSLL